MPTHASLLEQDTLRELIRATPASAKVKGMFIESCLRCYDLGGYVRPTRHRFRALLDYPLREFMNLMIHASSELYPAMMPSEALRYMGRLAYPTFVDSVLGRIIFAVARPTWKNTLVLSPRAYAVSMQPGKVSISKLTETSAIVHLRDIWTYPSCYQVGVFEGAMETFGLTSEIEARLLDRPCDADLCIHWTAPQPTKSGASVSTIPPKSADTES